MPRGLKRYQQAGDPHFITFSCYRRQPLLGTWEAFSYDARGQATDLYENLYNLSSPYHIQQGYFANGATASLQGFLGTGTSTPFSDKFSYNLDGAGRPYGMVDTTHSNTPIWASTRYNAASQPLTVMQSAGGSESFQYEYYGRMTQWQSTAVGNQQSNQQTGNLTWNVNGTLRQLQITDTYDSANAQTCLYGYDDLARLLSANCGSPWSQTFAYDQFGNIWKSGSSNFNQGYTWGNHVSGFSYDLMGNVTNDKANTYSYDAEGRPVSVNGGYPSLLSDAFGRTVQWNNGQGVIYEAVYGPQGQKFAFMEGATLVRYYMPMTAGMLAVHDGPDGFPANQGYFQHVDWLGSSRWASTGGATMQYDRAYAPFGEVYAEKGDPNNNYPTTNRNFTGQTVDTLQPLYDFQFRQQSPSQGRWLAPDPAGLAAVDITNPQTWNRYAYVGNNPLSNVDPLGLYSPSFSAIFWSMWGNLLQGNPLRFEYKIEPPDGGSGNDGGRRSGGGTPPPPAPTSPNTGTTSTCTVRYGRTTAPGRGQATGRGAFGFVPPNGSVAVDPMALGLFPGAQTNALLGPNASRITFSFSPTPNLPQGFPTTVTLGDVVDPGSRAGGKNFNGLYVFDIYRLPTLDAAKAATSWPPNVPVGVTVTYPSSLPINCGGPIVDPPLAGPLPDPTGVPALRGGPGW